MIYIFKKQPSRLFKKRGKNKTLKLTYLVAPYRGQHEQMQHNSNIKIVKATIVAKSISNQNNNLFSAL